MNRPPKVRPKSNDWEVGFFIAKRDVEKWVHIYQAYGDEGLMRSRKNQIYSFYFKLHVVKLYLSSEVSYQELALSQGMNNPALLTRWINDFRIAEPDALRTKKKGRKKSLNLNNGGTMIKNIYKDLFEFINKNKLIEETLKDFNVAFENWKMESPEHYNRIFENKTLESMTVIVKEVSIRLSEWPVCDRQYVVISLSIYDDNFFIGEYNWMYPISEKALPDDFLHFI